MPLQPQQKASGSYSRQLNRGSLALGKPGQMKVSTVSKTGGLSRYQYNGPLVSFSSWQEVRRIISGKSDYFEKNDPKIVSRVGGGGADVGIMEQIAKPGHPILKLSGGTPLTNAEIAISFLIPNSL